MLAEMKYLVDNSSIRIPVTSLRDEIRVLCWVMTRPESHESRAKHVKATWGKRCNILFFVSTVENAELPAISLQAPESRNILWGKTKLGFQVSIDTRNT